MYATKIPSDERSLVLRLIEGEEDAFCELYAAYKNRLIYFAMRFLKSREYAEDIFQDAFTIVWQGRVSSIRMLHFPLICIQSCETVY